MQNKILRTQQSFSHPLCSLVLTHHQRSTDIEMRLLSPHVTTRNLPETLQILKKHAPSVLGTKCHNDLHLPFRKEVCDTEMGHLFEHLIIDYLSQSCTDQDRVFYGVTEWNWHVDPRGIFHISLSAGLKDQHHLYEAITNSYQVIERVLTSPAVVTQSVLTQVTNTETVAAVSV